MSGHSMVSLAESNPSEALGGQPVRWGRSGVTGDAYHSQLCSFARGTKASPLCPDIYHHASASFVILRGKE